jgi:hypothetical protein
VSSSLNHELDPVLSEDAGRSVIAAAASRGSWHLTKVNMETVISCCGSCAQTIFTNVWVQGSNSLGVTTEVGACPFGREG